MWWMAAIAVALLAGCSPGYFFDDYPACQVTSGDGTLDLEQGCAGDACADGTYADWVAALGEPACSNSGSLLKCTWGGLRTYLSDDDEDGVIDDENEVLGYFYAESPYTGATSDGLGLGAELRCFVDAFGPPDEVTLKSADDVYDMYKIEFGTPDLDVYDDDGGGKADKLTIHGP